MHGLGTIVNVAAIVVGGLAGLLGGRRIPENDGRSASVSRPDPGKLTSRELADIRKRVMDGEKISF